MTSKEWNRPIDGRDRVFISTNSLVKSRKYTLTLMQHAEPPRNKPRWVTLRLSERDVDAVISMLEKAKLEIAILGARDPTLDARSK